MHLTLGARWLALAALGGALVACGGGPDVVRVVDGRAIGGAYVPPDAYAAFLRGAMAEEEGDARAALAAYREAAHKDGDDPEPWVRIGALDCALAARMPDGAERADTESHAARALDKALSLDGEYAPAWEARAQCDRLRAPRDPRAAADAVRADARAATADPRALAPELALAHDEETAGRGAAGERLLALTLVHRESAAAWDALAAWARTHDQPMLAARALAEEVRRAPERRGAIAERAIAMAGEGELVAARAVAAAAVDAEGPAVDPRAAWLAIDEALTRGDVERARARAARGHVGLEEAAGRALLLGAPDAARALAEPVADADPRAAGARMVLAAAALGRPRDPRALAAAFRGARAPHAPVPFTALAPLLALLADAAGPDAARGWLEALPESHGASGVRESHGARGVLIPSNDALVARAAADLAARGALDEALLPLDARIELAARRRAPPPEPEGGDVDARHRLLALTLLRPTDAATLALARHLAPASSRDALVAAALARIALARGQPLDAREAGRLADVDPADAIAVAAALDVARTRGDARAILPVRARLTALARTPAERDQARE